MLQEYNNYCWFQKSANGKKSITFFCDFCYICIERLIYLRALQINGALFAKKGGENWKHN